MSDGASPDQPAQTPAARLQRTPDAGPPRIRVGALIVRDERLLLVQQRRAAEAAPYWLLPGGGVRRGETLAAALAREVYEEIGIRVRPQAPLALAESISPRPDYPKHVIHVILAAAWPLEASCDNLRSRDPAVLAVRFIPAVELLELALRPPLGEWLAHRLHAGPPPACDVAIEYLGRLW